MPELIEYLVEYGATGGYSVCSGASETLAKAKWPNNG